MAQAIRTDAADQDLDEIAFYVARDGRPLVAERIVKEIIEKCDIHAAQPEMGTSAPHLGPGYRVFHHMRWVIIFRPHRNTILVLRILDGARDYLTLFRLD